MPVFVIDVHKIHSRKILSLLLIASALNFLDYYGVLLKVFLTEVVLATVEFTIDSLLFFFSKKSTKNVLITVKNQLVGMSGRYTFLMNQWIANTYITTKTDRIS